MKTKIISLTIAVAFATAFSAVAGGAGGSRSANPAPAQFTLKPIPASALPHSRQAPRIRNKNGTSLNWSGYSVYPLVQNSSVIETTKGKGNGKGNGKGSKPGGSTTPTFSDVIGSWIVPEVIASDSANTYSSAWIGIDGYADNTVEQIGTEQDWSNGSPVYYAWFEMYPKGGYEIVGFPVNPGDQIAAEVQFSGRGAFTLTLVNETETDAAGNPVTFSTTQRLQSAQRLSAEWVMEAPWSGGVLPLADFGSIGFSDCYATMNGTTASIKNGPWGIDPMTMEASDGTIEAEPSGLFSGGASFGVDWVNE